MLHISCILHPTDFSDLSKNAFRVACSLARDHRARLVVLHVISDLAAKEVVWDIIEPLQKYHDRLEQKLHEFATPDPQIPLEFRLEQGNPTRQIVQVARELPADMIVMGSHGRTGINRLLLGSVAEDVQRKAPCGVLTIKFPAENALPYQYLLPENRRRRATVGSA